MKETRKNVRRSTNMNRIIPCPKHLPDNILLPNRRPSSILVPNQLVLLIQFAALVRDRNDLAGNGHFLRRYTSPVTRNPQQGRLRVDGGREVRVGLEFLGHAKVVLVVGHQSAHEFVVGVQPGLEELGQKVGLLGGGRRLLKTVSGDHKNKKATKTLPLAKRPH